MPRRTINFTDLGTSPAAFEESDRPNGNLLQGIGEIFRQNRDRLTDAQWTAVEARYCLDESITSASRRLRVTRKQFRALIADATARLIEHAKDSGIT